MIKRFNIVFALLLLVASASISLAANPLVMVPEQIKLTGPDAQQTLLLEEVAIEKQGASNTQQFIGEVTGEIVWTSSDEKIVKVARGIATPVNNGKATITAKSGDRIATAEVQVEKFDAASQVTFRNHVQSVLSKAGCNTGACHGAAIGKNGFKLSLRGYDSDADFSSITRQARGRRVTPDDPARSLLLTKPTGTIPHKGGVRFEVQSPEYNTIARWIAEGAPGPSDKDPSMTRLEMLPGNMLLKKGAKQRVIVRAHFSDGHVEDVTRLVKFSSSNESVATVDQFGQFTVTGNGEGFIGGWYLSQNAIATVTVQYEQPIAREIFAQAPRRNFIDDLVLKQLERLNLPPSARAGDEEFVRRAFIDTIGTLPTADEVRAFLDDKSLSKRDALIDSLLNRPEFVDYWTYKWSDLFLVNSEKLKPAAMWSYYRWLRHQVAGNAPWDKLAREVVTATGSTLENGAANFFVLHGDPADLAETTSQAFLGMSINCAKCHNHPLEKWTNDQYYSMANLFARVQVKDAAGEGNAVVFTNDRGDLLQPRTGKPQPPAPLDAEALSLASLTDRRAYLADWLVSPTNPYFARAVTNRVWANYMSVGLVESIDDLRLTNPASNEELLNAVAKHLIDNKYDLKSLMRVILQSETYQRTSRTLPENMVDRRYYSRYYPRRLMAEVLLDGISQVTGSPTEFRRESADRVNRNLKDKGEPYPGNFRAIQLPDSNVLSYFLKSFGRAQRLLTCECERTDEPSMVQVLHISNGDTINEKLSAKGNRIEQIMTAGTSNDKIVEDAYLCTLARFPTADEKQQLIAALTSTPADERRTVLEDLYWSLMSSKEFLLNR